MSAMFQLKNAVIQISCVVQKQKERYLKQFVTVSTIHSHLYIAANITLLTNINGQDVDKQNIFKKITVG